GNGNVVTVTDRTVNGVSTKATANLYEGAPTSTELVFNGMMDGGTSIPDSGRMKIGNDIAQRLIDGENVPPTDIRYSEGDAFLQVVGTGEGYVAGRYGNKTGTTGFLGYVVAGESTASGNVPSSGTATYNGTAHATMFSAAGA